MFLVISFVRCPLSYYPNFDLLGLGMRLNLFTKHSFNVAVCSSRIGDLLSLYKVAVFSITISDQSISMYWSSNKIKVAAYFNFNDLLYSTLQ